MRAQRVREAESRIEMQVAKWTAEGAVKGRKTIIRRLSILRRRTYVSCQEYVGILQSAWECTRESRWHRGKDLDLPSLTE